MRLIRVGVVFFVVFLLLFGIPAYFLGYFHSQGEEAVFEVQRGENFAQIAGRLQSRGIIQSERALRWYVNLSAPAKKLKRGEFGLRKNMPIPDVIHALTEGKPMEYKFTVPEGQNMFQVADLLVAQGFIETKTDFLNAARSEEVIALLPTIREGERHPASIEGYIFPDTYMLQKSFSAREIAAVMVQRFREVFQKLSSDLEASATVRALGLSPHEVIVLASIVEKETGAAEERPVIASVFINRLRRNMRLQTDPTIIYGLWLEKGTWDGKIGRKDLDARMPYNTYQVDGLPPGPIANPGLNAMQAVLNPAETEYYYFVSKNDGTHVFSSEYKDHNRAVKEYQLKAGAKEGKSWRNLPANKRVR